VAHLLGLPVDVFSRFASADRGDEVLVVLGGAQQLFARSERR
jgi:hypothetical protein